MTFSRYYPSNPHFQGSIENKLSPSDIVADNTFLGPEALKRSAE